MNEPTILILGTSAMLVMVIAIISFAFMFQRKLIKKQKEYAEIESLLRRQELTAAYSMLRGQDAERRRIASDIHDNIGSMLATLKIYSDLVIGKTKEAELLRLSTKINELVEDLTQSVRRISHSLDTGTLINFGLKPALEQLCEALHQSGKIKIDCIVDIEKPMNSEMSVHIYRIAQELLTNTLKHAHATKVRFEISQISDEVSIIYEDNGIGFDVSTIHTNKMGLNNINTRVHKLQGDIRIQSTPRGSTFIIEIPFKSDEPQ